MFGLGTRDRRPEVMDQPGLSADRHAAALRALARINWLSRSAGLVWPPLLALARRLAPRPVRVLDVATGGGDIPVRLWRRARRAGVALAVEGCDVSATAVSFAAERAAAAGANVRFYLHDALRGPLPDSYDAVTCSLFLHHLSDEEAVGLLRRMAAAAPLVVVNDLVRGVAGFVLAWLGARLLTRSDVVHTDGPLSVRAAYTVAEARALAEQAGLAGARVARRWPCRFLLTWERP
jgi:2-polyprenyl-3-methyl-5-hydroxy-6-metoxy-1,4-benzoquinol methylase